MKKDELKHLIRRGEAAIRFIEELAQMPRGRKIEINLNELANHGIAVARLVSAVDQMAKENEFLNGLTRQYEKKINDYELNNIEPVVNERFENLKKILKSCLIDCIDDF